MARGQARSPSLDDDPVLWREWRRGRPSRLARIIWGFYIALALACTAWSVVTATSGGDTEIAGVLTGLQATFGLLLVSVVAPTALAEERARGSLDVLMTTPVSTDRIVLAKWWGAYRLVPAVAFLPSIASARRCVRGAGDPGSVHAKSLGRTTRWAGSIALPSPACRRP